MICYPLTIDEDAYGFRITCPPLDEVEVEARSREEALPRAEAAVFDALITRLQQQGHLPRPPSDAPPAVIVPTMLALRLHLFWALEEEKICRAGLARLLGWTEAKVDSLFHHGQATPMDLFDQAFAALGKQLSIQVI